VARLSTLVEQLRNRLNNNGTAATQEESAEYPVDQAPTGGEQQSGREKQQLARPDPFNDTITVMSVKPDEELEGAAAAAAAPPPSVDGAGTDEDVEEQLDALRSDMAALMGQMMELTQRIADSTP